MLRNSEGKIMVARLGYFFAGEIIIGIILITLLIPTSLPATYFLLKFSRLTLSVTFNIFMYLKLFSYKNKMAVPKLEKIVINMGVGEAKDNANIFHCQHGKHISTTMDWPQNWNILF